MPEPRVSQEQTQKITKTLHQKHQMAAAASVMALVNLTITLGLRNAVEILF